MQSLSVASKGVLLRGFEKANAGSAGFIVSRDEKPR
jgi:hypothetical protein